MKTIAIIIHARKDSTRCPNKHLRDLGNGNTLIDIALSNLSKLTNVDEKYLAAYDEELKEHIIDGIDILDRKYEAVAPGNAPHSIMYDHLNNVKSDYIINYNPCQPFVKVEELQKVIDWYKSSDCKSAITVKKERNFFWNIKQDPMNFVPNDRLSTTSGPWLYTATHSLVFYEKQYMLDNWQLFPNLKNAPYPIEIDWHENELIDVDTELDFKLAKLIYNGS
jgi:CMP-N-acetylneuraminic acid synthetase